MTVHRRSGSFRDLSRTGSGVRLRVAAVLTAVLLAACVPPIETGPPIRDPAALAARAQQRQSSSESATLRFTWRYGDRRGDVRGEGVARFNPPDSLRLDLFTSGEVAMAVSLAGGSLTSAGQIEEVELPPTAFLYAMAGLYHPENLPLEGYEAGAERVLVAEDGAKRTYFFLLDDRLTKLEQRVNGRTRRRVRITWEGEGAWPSGAEYRDFQTPSRVRWWIEEATPVPGGHSPDIYELSSAR